MKRWQVGGMTDERINMLRSLQIDRSPTPTPARRGPSWLSIALAGVAGAGGILGLLWLLDTGPTHPQAEASAPSAPAASPAPSPSDTAAVVPSPGPQSSATPPVAAPAAARPQGALVASGFVVARRIATVSSEAFGRITEVLVEEGMAVTEGQVLARLDSTLAATDLALAEARVLTARATLDGLRAELAEAQRVLSRLERLSARDAASEAALTQAKARAAVRRADVARAEGELRVAELTVERNRESLDKLIIRAPFAGIVVDKNAQPGEILSPSAAGGGFTRTGICTIVDMSSLEVEVDVNEAFIGRVAPGQMAEAVLDAYPDWRIPAQVIAIIPTANRDRATIKVRVALKERDGRVLRDMAAKVTFLDRPTL